MFVHFFHIELTSRISPYILLQPCFFSLTAFFIVFWVSLSGWRIRKIGKSAVILTWRTT